MIGHKIVTGYSSHSRHLCKWYCHKNYTLESAAGNIKTWITSFDSARSTLILLDFIVHVRQLAHSIVFHWIARHSRNDVKNTLHYCANRRVEKNKLLTKKNEKENYCKCLANIIHGFATNNNVFFSFLSFFCRCSDS